MSKRIKFTFVFVILLVSINSIHASEIQNELSAELKATQLFGTAKIDITPDFPVRMYGYGSRKTESEGIAGRLFAKALAIGGNEKKGPAVLLTVDNGAMPPELTAELLKRLQAKTKIKTERFVLCHSHCHSGPNIKGKDSLSGRELEHIQRYCRQLIDRLENVILQALSVMKPGHLSWGEGNVDFAMNRRVLTDGKWTGFGAVKDGPVDHSLPLLCVTDKQGKLVTVVVNYACHCTTLRGNFKKIHGDWSACAQRFIEADHPGVVAMVCIGCGADSDPYPHGTTELAEQHGRAVSKEVGRLLKEKLARVKAGLKSKSAVLKLPYNKLPSRDKLEELTKKSWSIGEVLKDLKDGKKVPEINYRITTWELGADLTMIFLTGEVIVDYAFRLKREIGEKGKHLWISAYAHEVPCYIISKRLITEGGYEVNNSMSSRISFGQPEEVIPLMEDRIVNKIKRMLNK